MKVLVACEFSGAVRDAFRRRGHDAVSCDLLPSEVEGPHVQGDVIPLLTEPWDLVVAFPPCTHLCSSGARWFPQKRADGSQQVAVEFFMRFTRLSCPWAIENPVGIMSRLFRRPDQIVQPWQFGHGETKATCLWLNRLQKLQPTQVVDGRAARVHRMAPGPRRAMERSRTYAGIAEAMAEQWGAQ